MASSSDSKTRSTGYFPPLSSIKTDNNERIEDAADAHSISGDENVSSPNSKAQKDANADADTTTNLSNSPTTAASEPSNGGRDSPNTNYSHSPKQTQNHFPKQSPPSSPPPPQTNFSRIFAYGLVGMTIDYNGDIISPTTKTSVGKASGDITEMIGQKIDEDGMIRNAAGEEVGQVAQNYGLQEAVAAMLEVQKAMSAGGGNGHANAGTNGKGNANGNNLKYTPMEEGEEVRSGINMGDTDGMNGANNTDSANGEGGTNGTNTKEKSQELPNIWQGTAGDAAPGNDIHLNVQSTKEGISMSIRIPTLFAKEQHREYEEEKRAREQQNQT